MFCILIIYPAYVSKHNSNREKQVILLMIQIGKGCHYVAVKKLVVLLKVIKSQTMIFNVGIVFILLEQKINLNHIVKIKIFAIL